MRSIIHIALAGIATIAFSSPASAEEKPTTLPEIVIGGEGKPPTKPEHCVGLETGSSQSYKCLNDTLQHQVDRTNPQANTAPVDAHSPDIKVGVVNIPAVKQQYGKNFGVSVIPYRPPLPVYSAPLGPRR
jgi:hypothetical protein